MRFRFAVLLAAVLVLLPTSSSNAQKRFSGPFIDLGANQEHVVGGSLIEGVDVLSEDTRIVFSAGVGYRYQFDFGLVLGAGVSKGWLDGELDLDEDALTVDWSNDSQWDWEASVGFTPIERLHIFFFASEVTRKFDVSITQGAIRFSQTDEQGMLRLGLGAEAFLMRGLSARLKMGTGRADFGDLVTNIDIERKAHVSAGLRFTF